MKLRIVLSLVLLSLFAFSNQSKKAKNDLERMNLKGKVKSLKEVFSRKDSIRTVKENEVIYLFDRMGNNIEKKEFYFIDEHLFNEYKWARKFDKNGNLTEEHCYNSHGKLDSLWIHKYDSNWNLIEKYEKKSLPEKEIYKYDLMGKIVAIDYYNSYGNLNATEVFHYDEKEQLIEVKTFVHINEVLSKMTNLYDFQGNIKEQTFYAHDSIELSKHTYQYDERKNIIEDVYCLGKYIQNNMTSKYDYDSQGNWVKRISSNKYNRGIIEEREIEYYN